MMVLVVPIRARQLLQRGSIAAVHRSKVRLGGMPFSRHHYGRWWTPASISGCEDACMPALNISLSLHSGVAIVIRRARVNRKYVASAGVYAQRSLSLHPPPSAEVALRRGVCET